MSSLRQSNRVTHKPEVTNPFRQLAETGLSLKKHVGNVVFVLRDCRALAGKYPDALTPAEKQRLMKAYRELADSGAFRIHVTTAAKLEERGEHEKARSWWETAETSIFAKENEGRIRILLEIHNKLSGWGPEAVAVKKQKKQR